MDLGDCVCRMERGATLVNDKMRISGTKNHDWLDIIKVFTECRIVVK